MDRIKNQNEEGVDCGGVCDKCEVIAPIVVPCEAKLQENHITVDGVDYALTRANYITQQADFYEISIALSKNDQSIDIQLYGKLPKVSTVYKLKAWPYVGRGEACIIYSSSLATGDSAQGELYLNYQDGKPFVEVCGATLINFWNDDIEFSGKIRCLN